MAVPAGQLPSTPYKLLPTYTPARGERLPDELKDLISEYQNANYSILNMLINHGGFDEIFNDNGKLKSLSFQKGRNVYPMTIHRERFVDYSGMKLDIPYITSSQYMDLYFSMLRPGHAASASINAALHRIYDLLLVAINSRAAVHDWHLLLPSSDSRAANNPKHAAFLERLRRLRDAIARRLF